MKTFVGSSTVNGLNVSHNSDPGLRIVGVSTSQERCETLDASSIQQMSMPSFDRIEFSLRSRPLKMKRLPNEAAASSHVKDIRLWELEFVPDPEFFCHVL